MYKTIMIVDVEKSGGRSDVLILAMRDALYRCMEEAFTAASLDWDAVRLEDRGDGILMIIPADVPKVEILDPLIGQIVVALRHHSTISSAEAQLRLRLALHAGEVHDDGHGCAGRDVVHAFRLCDADQGKRALGAHPAARLAMIVSDSFYQAAVAPGLRSIDPSTYRRVAVMEKETSAIAWVHIPGISELPDLDVADGSAPGADSGDRRQGYGRRQDDSAAAFLNGHRHTQIGTFIAGAVSMGDGGSIGGTTVGRDLIVNDEDAW